MNITYHVEQQICFVDIPKNLELDDVLIFKQAIEPLMGKPQYRGMIINFAQVKHMDSAGIGTILQIHNYYKKQNKKLVLFAVDASILHILNKAGLDRLLHITNSQEDALSELDFSSSSPS